MTNNMNFLIFLLFEKLIANSFDSLIASLKIDFFSLKLIVDWEVKYSNKMNSFNISNYGNYISS